ncbi:MAG: Bug family tripartite tricarboxylate transporter substrate binding protein [Pseudolabrys sp.]
MTDHTKLRQGLSRRGVFTGAAFLGAAAATSRLGISAAMADIYPSQELEWIIYQSPGGLIDGSSRTIQPYLKKAGFASRIEFVRGASGRIARAQLFRSKPDGYTIMTEASPEEVLGEVIYNAEYKVAEFEPIFGWFVNAFNVYVQKNSPIKTFADFVKEAKSRKVTIGTLGKGGPSHLQLAVLSKKLGLKLQLVHFQGGAPAYSALLGGHVDASIGGSSSSRWADTVSFLAVFRKGRDPALPNVPTVGELGYDITPINEVIYANAGPKVPADRIAKLAAGFTEAFQDPDQVKHQKSLGVYPTLMSSSDLRAIINSMYGLVNEHKAELTG